MSSLWYLVNIFWFLFSFKSYSPFCTRYGKILTRRRILKHSFKQNKKNPGQGLLVHILYFVRKQKESLWQVRFSTSKRWNLEYFFLLSPFEAPKSNITFSKLCPIIFFSTTYQIKKTWPFEKARQVAKFGSSPPVLPLTISPSRHPSHKIGSCFSHHEDLCDELNFWTIHMIYQKSS